MVDITFIWDSPNRMGSAGPINGLRVYVIASVLSKFAVSLLLLHHCCISFAIRFNFPIVA